MYNVLNIIRGRDTMTIGEVIKKYCDEHGMSCRKFAIQSGVSSGYVSMLVNNRNPKTDKPIRPTIETYNDFAKTMGISVDELFEMIDDAPVTFSSKVSVSDISNKTKSDYHGLADKIVERLLEEDKIYEKREALRRDPKRRVLFDLAENGTEKDIDAAIKLLDALKATNPDFYDGDDPA